MSSTDKQPGESQEEYEAREREWDIFWGRYQQYFSFAKQLQDGFAADLETRYKLISTQVAMPHSVGINTMFTLNKDGRVKGSQLAWIYVGKILEYSVNVAETRISQQYEEKMARLKAEIEEAEQKNKKLEEKIKETDILSKKIIGLIELYDKYEAMLNGQFPPP